MIHKICKFINKSNNIHDFVRRLITLLVILKAPTFVCSKLYDFHYYYINKKINGLLDLSYEKYKQFNNVNFSMKNNCNNKNIWVFWYQGYKHMPDLIYSCLKSIINCSNGHKVILLTKFNLDKYAILPGYIYIKLHNGEITYTEFSDILRFNILKLYGGLWIDSTVYCIHNLPNDFFSKFYTSKRGYIQNHNNVSLGKWTSFLIGGNSYYPLFVFMDIFLKLYWKYNNSLIDYFLTDYALNYAYIHNISGFRGYVLHMKSNPSIFIMTKIGNMKYNNNTFRKLSNKTVLFKLSYKKHIKKNKNTFYYYLLNKY